MTLWWLNIAQVGLLSVLVFLQVVVMRDRALAVKVAREAADAAKLAATIAEKAAFTASMAQDRLQALFGSIESQGGKTLRATARMEDANAVVAGNLADAQHRADTLQDVAGPIGTIPGAAADAAARSAPQDRQS